MVNLSDGFNKDNAELLLKGMWYSQLPPLIDINVITDNVDIIFDKINKEECTYYKHDEKGNIKGFSNIDRSSNRYKNGAEPIVYYDYKNNGSWREMQIPNIIFYLAFVYNTIKNFDELFEPLYIGEMKSYTKFSNSYLVLGDTFVERDWYGEEIDANIKGHFTDRNTNKRWSMILNENKKRYLSAEKSYLYYLKMDIESFFPNLYTHLFERMGGYTPYKDFAQSSYFEFLDKFSMAINNSQTKGIPAGAFSSHISSELLMICVDFEIGNIIKGKDMGYIRYVDDLTFFADTKEELYKIELEVQKILNKYRLRINGNKTKLNLCAYYVNNTRLSELHDFFSYLYTVHDEIYDFDIDDFFKLKEYIYACLVKNEISQIKSLLTRLTNCIDNNFIVVDECDEALFFYCWKLIAADEKLTVNSYKLIDAILSKMSNDLKNTSLRELQSKNDLIDKKYADSITQIWHYYILNKYDSEFKANIIKNLNKYNFNPVVLATFVSEGYKSNSKIFKYIKERYSNEIEENNWKKTIMFSKWWLPIFKIAYSDGYNYENWIKTKAYPDILDILEKQN